ncbi:MAG: TVP38/TMEM64 family protein [Clostridia bacterium]|nr:TVP38/TMEM64 family protein [Clostridia bacterium]
MMNKEKKIKIFKIILTVLAIAMFVGLTAYLVPIMKGLLTQEGKEEYTAKAQSAGIGGVLSILGLEVAQIFVAILPGEPVEVVAGMCYGAVWGTILIMASMAIVSAIIYFLVRKYGKSFIYHFCKKEQIEKLENSKFFKNEKKIEWVLLLLFLIPGTPKDILVYLGGILPIKPGRFLLISTLGRFPSVITSTIAGAALVVGDWRTTIIVYAVTFGFVALFFIGSKMIEYRKRVVG